MRQPRPFALVLIALLGAASFADGASAILTLPQNRRVTELRKLAGDPANDPLPLLAELEGMGAAAHRHLADVARTVLAGDRRTIEAQLGQLGDPAKLAELEAALRERRRAARETIRKLDQETVPVAREHHERLTELMAAVEAFHAPRVQIATALARRPRLLELLRSAAPKDTSVKPDAEAQLLAQATAALGPSEELPGFATKVGEDDPRFQAWFAACCRRVQAWNARQRPLMSEVEWENLEVVNRYRELLGIMPYEVDPRLLQAARKHSKEMVELGFFGHTSPTEGRRTHIDRMRLEGYKGGSSENCASGPRTGAKAFWQLFGSPSHHKAMAGGCTHIGIGHWDRSMWTQTFGNGKRLMLMTEEERRAHAFTGEALAPQVAAVQAERPRRR